jgi:hypothetical protein
MKTNPNIEKVSTNEVFYVSAAGSTVWIRFCLAPPRGLLSKRVYAKQSIENVIQVWNLGGPHSVSYS